MILEFVKSQIASSEIIGTVFDTEKAIGRSLSSAGKSSAIASFVNPIFSKPDVFGKQRDESLICGLFSKIFSVFLTIIRVIYNAFDHTPVFSLITKAADYIISLSFSKLCAVAITLILCVYHDNWNNGYMLAVSFLLALLYFVRLIRLGKKKSCIPVSFYLFILACAAIIPISGVVSANLRVFTYFISAFTFLFCIAGSVEDISDIRSILMILYIAVLYNSILAVIQGYYGVPVNTSYTDINTNPDMPGRVYASYFNPNNFAEILCLLTPACFVAFMGSARLTKAAKIFVGASFIIPILALVLTYSRSAWISFALTVCSMIGVTNLALVPVVLVLAVLSIPFLPYSIKNRIMSLFTGTDSSVGYRIYIWQGCYDTMLNDPMGGFGLGPDNFFAEYSKFMNANAMKAPHSHNLYLEIWMETGIFGFLTYIVFFTATLKNSFLNAVKKGSKYRNFSVALFSAMFGLIFMSLVEYIWFYPRTMLCYFVVLGLIWGILRLSANEK